MVFDTDTVNSTCVWSILYTESSLTTCLNKVYKRNEGYITDIINKFLLIVNKINC